MTPSFAQVRALSVRSPSGSSSVGWQDRQPRREACRRQLEAGSWRVCRGRRRPHSRRRSQTSVLAGCRPDHGRPGSDPGIGNAAGQTPGNAHPAFRLANNSTPHPTSAARHRKPRLPSCGKWMGIQKKQRYHQAWRRGTFCPVSEGRVSNHSLHQISRLSYVRQRQIAPLMNNPG